MAGDRAGALAHIDDDAILERIRSGEHSSAIAASLGVHKAAISHRYKGRVDYLEARELGAEVRLDQLDKELAELSKPLPQPTLPDEPTDAELQRYRAELKAWQMSHAEREFNLARVERQWRTVSWRNEREFPHRWGQKQEVHHTFSISDELQAIAERRQLEAAQHDVSDAHIISESGRK